ncbi:DUF5675 family protein [Nitrospinaceae bacterium]|nr:DUF5675 family protein [Nitrospinaceae bacterium]
MLHLQKVPGFEFILIHVGNADENTAGYLLVGTGARAGEGDMSIRSSRVAYKKNSIPKLLKLQTREFRNRIF